MKRLFLLAIIITFISSCDTKPKKIDFKLRGNVFGTTYKIVCLNADKNYKKSIDSLFFLINKSTSTYLPTSDISLINKGDTTVVADAILLELIEKSKEIYKETEGYFDPTVGNLVNAWGFGPKDEKRNLDSLEIREQMKLVGFDKIRVLNKKVIKENPAIFLDFNSIGKGFGIDIIARFFESKNIDNYMIEIGGEIRAKGAKKSGKSWRVQIQNPDIEAANQGFSVINLSNKSMATSGNYRKFRVTNNGQKYVHTVNPKTGFATESNLLSVSVIGALDCADVDAYATAFMAMGLEKAKEFVAKSKNLEVFFIYLDNQQNLTSFNNIKE